MAVQVDPNVAVNGSTAVNVHVEDDGTILSLSATFASTITKTLNGGEDGTSGDFTLTGAELGEGLGDLVIVVSDDTGATATQTIVDLVVDLTPPAIALEPCVLNATGQGPRGAFQAWVGDAWALSAVALLVDDEPIVDVAFDEWPATLGTAWDWSYVSFASNELPTGAHDALLTVTDKGGNVTEAACDLVVDGNAPVVSATVTAGADIVVDASATDLEGDVSLDVVAGGFALASAPGPSAQFTLHPGDFPAGELAIYVLARDAAGNEGASPVTTVVIE
jgi:hypothetical protein